MTINSGKEYRTIAATAVTTALTAALTCLTAAPAIAETVADASQVQVQAQSVSAANLIGEGPAALYARAHAHLQEPKSAEVAMLGLVSTEDGLVYRIVLEKPDGGGYRVDVDAYTGDVLASRYDFSCLFVTPGEAILAATNETGQALVSWGRQYDPIEGWFYYVATRDARGEVTVWQVDMLENVYHTWMSLDEVRIM